MKYVLAAIISFILSATANAQFGSIPSYNPGANAWPFSNAGGIVSSKDSLIKGNPLVLAGKKIQVTIVFDSVQVEEYGSETKLVQDMTAYYEKKGAGRGKIWSDNWYLNKNVKFKELFITKFNQLGKKNKTTAQVDSTGADYHLIITTSYLNIGDNWGINKQPALINAICDFRDRNGSSAVVVAFRGVPGQTVGAGDYDISTRVAQCYQKLGKDLYGKIADRLIDLDE